MGCKALFIGGIKSGKSKNAEKYTLELSPSKPIYLATNEFFDEEMQQRVTKHKLQREEKFITIEEPLKLTNVIQKQNTPVLVECVSMWINNMLYHGFGEEKIFQELQNVAALQTQTIWVINDVGCSVVSENKLVREFVDINGRAAQFLASNSQEVFYTIASISTKIK